MNTKSTPTPEQASPEPVENQDPATQLLKTIEETVAPVDTAADPADPASAKRDADQLTESGLTGTDRDQTGSVENRATES